MIDVDRWTGEEALLLQDVMRASVRGFADYLGISPRTVTQWRQNPARICRLGTAQILDTALAQCSPEQKKTFLVRLAELRGEPMAHDEPPSGRLAGPCRVVTHRFLPVFVGGRLSSLASVESHTEQGPGGLEHQRLSADHPNAHATLHAHACGVAVFHLEEPKRFESLTELAVWRYRTYREDRQWAAQALSHQLHQHGIEEDISAPEYVLSAYELCEHPWQGSGLGTALQLLATPSVLVDRHPVLSTRG